MFNFIYIFHIFVQIINFKNFKIYQMKVRICVDYKFIILKHNNLVYNFISVTGRSKHNLHMLLITDKMGGRVN